MSVLSDDAPPVSADEAAALLQDAFGLEGELTALQSERDHNFRVRTAQGEYVLKIGHPGEARAIAEFQTAALREIAAADPTLAVPAVIPARDGAFTSERRVGGVTRIVRLLTYLPGRLLIQSPRSAAQDRALGGFLARLGHGLRGFRHPAMNASDILWDLRRLAEVKPLLPRSPTPRGANSRRRRSRKPRRTRCRPCLACAPRSCTTI